MGADPPRPTWELFPHNAVFISEGVPKLWCFCQTSLLLIMRNFPVSLLNIIPSYLMKTCYCPTYAKSPLFGGFCLKVKDAFTSETSEIRLY